jgi:glycosyltransferase involved in cell wall biosynthesis
VPPRIPRRIAKRLYQATGWRPLAPLVVPGPRRSPGRRPRSGAVAFARRDAVLIQPSGVVNRGRVLRVAGTLLDAGWSVAFMTKLSPRRRTFDVEIGEAMGCPLLSFPDAHAFLGAAKVRVPALNWALMVQYLNAAMWSYVRAMRPRVIHTFGVNAIGLGHDFRDRLRADGHDAAWFHDFLERTTSHRFHNDRVADGVEDIEWRGVVVASETAHARHPDHSFTVSPSLAAALVADYGLDREPTVLLNAPRLRDFDGSARPTVREAAGVGPGVPLIVYAGGVTPLRGIETLVAALARLPQAHLALMIPARSPYMLTLLAQARAAGCAARLHFLRYVDPHRISSFMRDATVGVHPLTRYGNAEVALPNKLFDYLHAGLPVVVSDCRSMADFVQRHQVGRVFGAGDAQSLAAALREVIANGESLRARIAAAGVREAFCWERGEAALLEPYRRCFEMPRTGDGCAAALVLGESA